MTLRSRVNRIIHLIKNRQFHDKANIYELQEDLEVVMQLLDRAIMGLENCCGRSIWVDMEAKETLADIRKELGGDALKTTTGHDNNIEKRGKR